MSNDDSHPGKKSGFDFERARQYACRRLEQELPATLFYHNVAHTVDEVVPAATRLAELESITGESLQLLLTAAYYHDLGFVEDRLAHETVSLRIMGEVLPEFGYSEAQIGLIGGIVMATRLPQSPTNLLEAILADADLVIFGQTDFLARNRDLRAELAAFGQIFADEAWVSGQLTFIRKHDYFTAAARRLWGAQKEENIRRLKLLLA